jgi:hypothetical protein
MRKFQINDPSLESQWRAIILFGKNSATYKFAFASSILQLVNKETTEISLEELAKPFSKNIVEHLKINDKQGNSNSSAFLDTCRKYIKGNILDEELWLKTEKLGFVNVVDAFQNVNGGEIPDLFYEKDYNSGKKKLVIKDNLLKLKESSHFQNFPQEVEARWSLVETAWNLKLNPALLEVQFDEDKEIFFLENNFMKRVDITSVRDALNGYQKGKCFYSFEDISIVSRSNNLCDIDHFLPHVNKVNHHKNGANINGVWNLVLSSKKCNRGEGGKFTKIPEKRFLERLHNRNEFYIESKHPLAETIINQTGNTKSKRINFLNTQYQVALNNSIVTWQPENELEGNF